MKDEFEKLVFDKGLFYYIKSLQEVTGMNDEEAGTMFYIMDMWDKKKHYTNTRFTLANPTPPKV